MKKITSLLVEVYKRLLHFFPTAFREEFEEDMVLDFEDKVEAANAKSGVALFYVVLRELRDFPVNLIKAHMGKNSMVRIIRSQPVNHGLRGALGFGIAYGLAWFIQEFIMVKLYVSEDAPIGLLQVYYFDLFHTEHGLELISWIPSALSSLLTGLLVGVAIAVLFADRSKHLRFVLVGMLSWFLHDAVRSIFWHTANLGFFLGTRHSIYFEIANSVLSGAFLGLMFIIAKSERRSPLRLLLVGSIVYPLGAYFYVRLLFKLFIVTTPWLFIALMALLVVFTGSVLLIAVKIEHTRKVPWMVIWGALGLPLLPFLRGFLPINIFPHAVPNVFYYDDPLFWQFTFRISMDQAIYGVILGAILGLILGFQKRANTTQATSL